MTTATTTKAAKTATPGEKAKLGRKTLRKLGRDKRKAKLQASKEDSAKFHEAKSTRALAKKVAFRKKKSAKK